MKFILGFLKFILTLVITSLVVFYLARHGEDNHQAHCKTLGVECDKSNLGEKLAGTKEKLKDLWHYYFK